MNRLQAIFVALALPLAASCSEFEFAEQDIAISFDDEADTLELSIDTRGIFGTTMGRRESDSAIDVRAAARVRQMADGYRYFHLLAWPLIFDLDETQDPGTTNSSDEADPAVAALLESWYRIRDGVSVVEARTYLDPSGEVAVFQRVRVEHATELVKTLNALISAAVFDAVGPGDGSSEDVFESLEARALLLAHAEAGRTWITLDARGISLHVPMTAGDLAKILRDSLGIAADGSKDAILAAALGHALLHDLSGIDVDGRLVTLRFSFAQDGRIDVPFRSERRPAAERLRAQFAKGELDD